MNRSDGGLRTELTQLGLMFVTWALFFALWLQITA